MQYCSSLRFKLLALILGVGAFAPAHVFAQEDAFAGAEQAFVELEYERAIELARQALADGNNDLAATRRLYDLIGTSASFVGDEAGAYEAYRRLLALDGDAELDESLPPQLRTSFLRARGWWGAQPNGFGARPSLGPTGPGGPLRFVARLSDPLEIVTTLRLSIRLPGQPWGPSRDLDLSSAVATTDEFGVANEDLSDAENVEYFLQGLDAEANVVLAVGDTNSPERVANPTYSRGVAGGGGETTGGGGSVLEEWWFWTLVVGVVGAGVAVGVYFAVPPELNGVSAVRW